MGRVFEALQREQKRKKREGVRDPLVQTTGSPADLPDLDDNPHLEVPEVIGTPIGPRSNEGLLLPGGLNGTKALAIAAATEVLPMLPRLDALAPPEYLPPQTREPQGVKTVRLLTGELHQRLVMLREPHAAGCEQYRTLRTQLFHAAERQRTQIVTVSSAVAGEGKTSTVINLAAAIAQSREKRALVIDGDLRRPTVASFLNLKPGKGLGEVLSQQCKPLDAVIRAYGQEFYLLPAAARLDSPTELLSSERMIETLSELREYFDFILIDSPPVTPFADARLLANLSDTVLLVVRAGVAPYETVEQAVESLAPSPIMGVVLNGVEGMKEADYYEEYYEQEHNEHSSFLWQNLAPVLRDSWIGKKLKL